MEYCGRYSVFDLSKIRTYPFAKRINKVSVDDLVYPHRVSSSHAIPEDIASVAAAIVDSRAAGLPVILFTGAHLVKNGLGPLIIDLIERDRITLVAGNAATAIHDFELAFFGATSEYVPDALGKGLFGMAAEFGVINAAISLGNEARLGFGESLGRTICDAEYRRQVFEHFEKTPGRRDFAHPEVSILATCYEKGVPFTVHAGIGTDVTDQHPSFDGCAKGGCSGRDFLIYTAEASRLASGGVVLNIGSAVTGPEVLLKALSMCANIGRIPSGIVTADFDIRAFRSEEVTDESREGYYYRDQKSVVTRIPQAFSGTGVYIQGDQRDTVASLYRALVQKTAGTHD
jgi:hypothetical protein